MVIHLLCAKQNASCTRLNPLSCHCVAACSWFACSYHFVLASNADQNSRLTPNTFSSNGICPWAIIPHPKTSNRLQWFQPISWDLDVRLLLPCWLNCVFASKYKYNCKMTVIYADFLKYLCFPGALSCVIHDVSNALFWQVRNWLVVLRLTSGNWVQAWWILCPRGQTIKATWMSNLWSTVSTCL